MIPGGALTGVEATPNDIIITRETLARTNVYQDTTTNFHLPELGELPSRQGIMSHNYDRVPKSARRGCSSVSESYFPQMELLSEKSKCGWSIVLCFRLWRHLKSSIMRCSRRMHAEAASPCCNMFHHSPADVETAHTQLAKQTTAASKHLEAGRCVVCWFIWPCSTT